MKNRITHYILIIFFLHQEHYVGDDFYVVWEYLRDSQFKVRSAPPESEMTKEQWACFETYCNSLGGALINDKKG